ncbi:hypothetical protein EGW08_019897, partial [Elysia chlorotica]
KIYFYIQYCAWATRLVPLSQTRRHTTDTRAQQAHISKINKEESPHTILSLPRDIQLSLVQFLHKYMILGSCVLYLSDPVNNQTCYHNLKIAISTSDFKIKIAMLLDPFKIVNFTLFGTLDFFPQVL